jgi:hypothetical protein
MTAKAWCEKKKASNIGDTLPGQVISTEKNKGQ